MGLRPCAMRLGSDPRRRLCRAGVCRNLGRAALSGMLLEARLLRSLEDDLPVGVQGEQSASGFLERDTSFFRSLSLSLRPAASLLFQAVRRHTALSLDKFRLQFRLQLSRLNSP